ncbi:hypothetical protein [Leptospira alexanderi]|nr:hypothetical protein [Leptospira alexanderi]
MKDTKTIGIIFYSIGICFDGLREIMSVFLIGFGMFFCSRNLLHD